MFNIKGTLLFFIVIAIPIILNFEKCKGETDLIKLQVYNGTVIDVELEGNPSTGFMWYTLSLTEQMPNSNTSSGIVLPEISEGKNEKRELIINEETNVIVSPLHRKNKDGIIQHLIGASSTFHNNITVFVPGTYYVKYVYVKAALPPVVAFEIVFEVNVENNSAAVEENNSTTVEENSSAGIKENNFTEEKFFMLLNVTIETKMSTVEKAVHAKMEGNAATGNFWFIYDVTDNSHELKTLQQNVSEENYSVFAPKNESNILVTNPSVQSTSLHSTILGQGCTFGSVITPQKSGTYYIVYYYKNVSSQFVQKYKIIKLVVF